MVPFRFRTGTLSLVCLSRFTILRFLSAQSVIFLKGAANHFSHTDTCSGLIKPYYYQQK